MSYKIPGSDKDTFDPAPNNYNPNSINSKSQNHISSFFAIPNDDADLFLSNTPSHVSSKGAASSRNLSPIFDSSNRKSSKKSEKKYVEAKASEGYRWIMSKLRKESSRFSVSTDSSKRNNSISQSVRSNIFLKRNGTIDSQSSNSKLLAKNSSVTPSEELSPTPNTQNKLRKPSLWNILKVPKNPSLQQNSVSPTSNISDSLDKFLISTKKPPSYDIPTPSSPLKPEPSIHLFNHPSSTSILTISDADLNLSYEIYGLSKNPKIDQPTCPENKSNNPPHAINTRMSEPISPTSPHDKSPLPRQSPINRFDPNFLYTLPDTSFYGYPKPIDSKALKSSSDLPLSPKINVSPQNLSSSKSQSQLNSPPPPLSHLHPNFLESYPATIAPLTSIDHQIPQLDPDEIAKSIYNYYSDPSIVLPPQIQDPNDFAEFLGGRSLIQIKTLEAYMNLFDFSNTRLDAALRKVCSRLLMQAESQVIDRILIEFSKKYFYSNQDSQFKSICNIHTVSFSIFLLNTDLHLADIKQSARMTKNQYTRNTIDAINMNANKLKLRSPSFISNTNTSAKSFSLSKNPQNDDSPGTFALDTPKYSSLTPQLPEISINEFHINKPHDSLNISSSSKSASSFSFDKKPTKLSKKYNAIRGRSQSRTYTIGNLMNSDSHFFNSSSADPFFSPNSKSQKPEIGAASQIIDNYPQKAHQISTSKSEYNINTEFNSLNVDDDFILQSTLMKNPATSSPTNNAQTPALNFPNSGLLSNSSPKKGFFSNSSNLITSLKGHSSNKPSDAFSLNNSTIDIASNYSKSFFGNNKRDNNISIVDLNFSSVLRDIYNGIKEKPLGKPNINVRLNKFDENRDSQPLSNINDNSNTYISYPRLSVENSKSRPSTGSDYPFSNSYFKTGPELSNLDKVNNDSHQDSYLRANKEFPANTSIQSRNSIFSQPGPKSKTMSYVNSIINRNSNTKEPSFPMSSTIPIMPQDSNFPSIIENSGSSNPNPPLASRLYFRCGLLNRKLLFDTSGKKSNNRSWRGCYLSIANGKALMYKGDNSTAPRIGLVGSLPPDVGLLNSIYLVHSYSQVMPKPGYSYTKPYVFALTLNDSSVYLFQTFEAEEANQWAFACNYWAALFTKVPYIAGSVNNSEYGWYPQNHISNRSNSMMELGIEPSINSSKLSGLGSISFSTKKFDKVDSIKDANRFININDWSPPPNPLHPIYSNEKAQIDAFSKHIDYLDSELNLHKTGLTQISERFHEKSLSYNRAFNNWEKKAQYLLKELIKYKNYVDCLKLAIKDFEALDVTNSESIARSTSNVETLIVDSTDQSKLNTDKTAPLSPKDLDSKSNKPLASKTLKKTHSSKLMNQKYSPKLDTLQNSSISSPKKLNNSISFNSVFKSNFNIKLSTDLSTKHSNQSNSKVMNTVIGLCGEVTSEIDKTDILDNKEDSINLPNNITNLSFSPPKSANLLRSMPKNSKIFLSERQQPSTIDETENSHNQSINRNNKSIDDSNAFLNHENEPEYPFLNFLTPESNLPSQDYQQGPEADVTRITPQSENRSKLADIFKPLDLSTATMEFNPTLPKSKRNSSPVKPLASGISLSRLVPGKDKDYLTSNITFVQNSNNNKVRSGNDPSKFRVELAKDNKLLAKIKKLEKSGKYSIDSNLNSWPKYSESFDNFKSRSSDVDLGKKAINSYSTNGENFEDFLKDYEYEHKEQTTLPENTNSPQLNSKIFKFSSQPNSKSKKNKSSSPPNSGNFKNIVGNITSSNSQRLSFNESKEGLNMFMSQNSYILGGDYFELKNETSGATKSSNSTPSSPQDEYTTPLHSFSEKPGSIPIGKSKTEPPKK
ncbi:PH and SEC7 domain-containing protein [Smittium culicis]|uniref:PH and SEC7 domain-containing protein n=1 Tax=Smittium culicis TaxID=133412 RepID=A0A1R1YIF5_9FUNG|nr:PH and SEC7 domain-containing protein [Smittium culicis]